MDERTAVVLLNLGGPTSLNSVQGFLFNLFSDPDIFKLPLGFITQKPFAYLFSRRRAPEAKIGYAALGGKSPLLENTERQAQALRTALAGEGPFDVFICMRYWHPLTREIVGRLKAKQYTRVILLPLYPQYSTTTTGSSRNEFLRECERQGYGPRYKLVEHWYDDPDYQQAIVDSIEAARAKFSTPDPAEIELLFSAHGLPQKIVDAGDPYERQVQATFEALTRKLGWPRTTLCYQSRVGPLKWLQPYTEQAIREKGNRGTRQMLVYPIAFVSDHIETLFELGVTYADLAKQVGIAEYRVVPALNDHPLLIRALKTLTLKAARQL